MKTFKRILIGLLALILMAVVAGYIFMNHIARKALPDYSKPVKLSGLSDEVHVYRDAHAMPHVYAKNEHDLYMTVGYLMAQDRLWQMDLLRRVTQGRLTEVFGADMVETDQLLRALRIPEKSALVLSSSDEALIQTLQAFSSGVNQFIEKHPKKLPPEFTIIGYEPEPWEPIHTVNLIGYMAWDLAGSWNNEITLHKLSQVLDEEKFRQLIPDLEFHQTFVHPGLKGFRDQEMFSLLEQSRLLETLGLEVFSASNSWAVSGQKSKTGHALFANDMHLGFRAPGIWYPMHQVVDGKLNVTGVVLPGTPLVIVGHNEHIAWGMTNVYVDEMDFYLETLNPQNPDQYLLDGEWRDLLVKEEKIITSKGDTMMRTNRFTHRGPLISGFKEIEDQAISMRWTGNEFSNELRSIYLLNRATNWDEFRDALSTLLSVSQNVIFADVNGNIGMQTCAGVPIRKEGNPIFILPGESNRYDWDGLLPFEKLPFTYNPPEGTVSSANNRTTDSDYPYYIGHWFDMSFRIDRIREMLNEKEKLNPDDFKLMHGDFKSKLVERYLSDLVASLSNAEDMSANEQQALELLRIWDMKMLADQAAPAIFERFYATFIKNILADEMGESLYKEFSSGLIRNMFDHVWRNRTSSWVDNINTADTESFDEIVFISFRETVQWLEKNLGNDPGQWEWGKIHQLSINHPMGSVKILDRVFNLNKGPFPVGGSFHTVNPTAYSFHNPYAVVHGASQRHVYDMGNLANSFVAIPTGTSGIPASKYYLDQTEMFINNEFRKDLWLKDDVINAARYHTIFSPE